MRVLITGGAGFIGSHTVDTLLAAGHSLSVVDDLSSGQRERIPSVVAFYQHDITWPGLTEIFTAARPEAVILLAAQVSVPRSLVDPLRDAEVNILGVLAVLEAARQTGVDKLVFASSAAVYGEPTYLPIDEAHPLRPLSPYGQSKRAAEQYIDLYARLYGLRYTVLRYANVYGPRQDAHGEAGVVTVFANALLDGRPATIYGTGEQTRDFIYVGDVARANLLALQAGDGQTLNIGSGAPTSVRQLWTAMAEAAGVTAEPRMAPPRPGDILHSRFRAAAARAALGWQTTMDLAAGLRQTLEYYKASMSRHE